MVKRQKLEENHWFKTIHSKRKIEQHETHCNLGVNSGSPEGREVFSRATSHVTDMEIELNTSIRK